MGPNLQQRYTLSFCHGLFCTLIFSIALPLAARGQEPGAPVCEDPTSLNCVITKEEVGAWTVSRETTPVGSGSLVRVATEATNSIPAIFGGDTTARLEIFCSENTTRFGIWFGDNFMSDIDGYGDVIYRVDDGPVQVVSFSAARDNQMLVSSPGIAAIRLVQQLFSAETLNISASSFTNTRISAQFEIGNLEEAIAPLRDACNW